MPVINMEHAPGRGGERRGGRRGGKEKLAKVRHDPAMIQDVLC